MTEWKSSIKEGLMTWKIEHLTLFSQRRRKERKKGRERKEKRQPKDLWNTMKRNNIHIIGVSGRKEKGIESIFRTVMAENFPNQGTRNRYPDA